MTRLETAIMSAYDTLDCSITGLREGEDHCVALVVRGVQQVVTPAFESQEAAIDALILHIETLGGSGGN